MHKLGTKFVYIFYLYSFMNLLDFIAFLVYTFLFSAIFSFSRKKIENETLKKYHRNAFWIKVFASFCYSIFVLYISLGDTTTLYYPEGHNLYQLILNDPSKLHYLFGPGKDIDSTMLNNPGEIGYFSDAGNFMVIRITAILCFFTFGQYLALNLVFSMIAFTGIWKLYRFFYEQYPQLHKQFAIAILYLPTFTFWSSGILKEPLVIAALGWLTYSLYQSAFKKRNIIINSIRVGICIYVFSVVKIYILVAYLPIFVVFLLLKNAMLIKNAFFKIILSIFFIGGSILIFIDNSDKMVDSLGKFGGDDLVETISVRQQNFKDQSRVSEGSFFSLGVKFDGSPGSLLRLAPAAINATLFRPYLWESRNVSTLLSSFESLAIMFLTLFVIVKVGIFRFVATIFKKPIVMFCFFYSLVFALFVGASTLNFGTLVRYKIPSMPFYVITLFLILFFNKKIGYKNEEVLILQKSTTEEKIVSNNL